MTTESVEELSRRMDVCSEEWATISKDLSDRSRDLFISQQINTENIEKNAKQMEITDEKLQALIVSTEGLVATWTTVTNLQKFIKWVASFAIVASATGWIYSHIGELNPFSK